MCNSPIGMFFSFEEKGSSRALFQKTKDTFTNKKRSVSYEYKKNRKG